MGLNLLFLSIELGKESVEKALVSSSDSTNSSDIWVDHKVFDVVFFESVIGFTAVIVGHLFSEMREESVKGNVFLIVKEILNIGSRNQNSVFIFSIFEFLDEW